MDEPEVVDALRAAGCVFAEREAEVLIAAEPDVVRRDRLVARRVAGEPLEYVVGWAEFLGFRWRVAPGVFVPRHRSELMVNLAVSRAALRSGRADSSVLSVIDLGCGTGALGLSVAARILRQRLTDRVEVRLVDIDPEAVGCARANLRAVAKTVHGLSGAAYVGDLAQAPPSPIGADLVIAHVPYVPTGAIGLMPTEARDYEAIASLDGGPDGLDVLRRAVQAVVDGRVGLSPGGTLLTECGLDQVETARGILSAAGLEVDVVHDPEDPDSEATVMIACQAG